MKSRIRSFIKSHLSFPSKRFIERPSLPPLFIAGILFWLSAGLFIAFASSQEVLPAHLVLLVGACVGGLSAMGALIAYCKRKTPIMLGFGICVIIVLGILVSQFAIVDLEKTRNSLVSAQTDTYTLTILDTPVVADRGYSCTAQAETSSGAIGKVRLYINAETPPSFGEVIRATSQLTPPQAKNRAFYQSNGLCGSLSIDSFEPVKRNDLFGAIVGLRNYYLSLWGDSSSEAAILLKALLLGERGQLYQTDLYQEVKVVGLAHIIAVSGAHLVIVSALVSYILSRFRLPRLLESGLQLAFIVTYLILVGIPMPCLRAACMACASLVAPLLFRRSSPLSNLGFVLIILIALDPFSSVSLSFMLSALATLGIVLFMPLFNNLVNSLTQSIPSLILDPLLMTLASLVLVTPLCIATFSQVSLIAPLANVVATPFASLLCCLGMIMLLVSPIPVVGDVLFAACMVLAQVFIEVCHVLAQVPFASIPSTGNLYVLMAISSGCALLLWVFWPRTIKGSVVVSVMALFAVVMGFSFMGGHANRIIMLDVGQGDAILIQSEGKNVLVDTSNQDTLLLAGLARYHVTSLDAVVITHEDDDHCGSLSALRGVVGVKKVVLAEGSDRIEDPSAQELVSSAHELSSNVSFVSTDQVMCIGTLTFEIINPPPLTDEYGNEESICLLLTSDDNQDNQADSRTLLCGDAEAEVLEAIVQDENIEAIDILKVAHHGSRNAVTEDLLNVLDPSVALISVGEHNSYGHPADSVIELLEEHDVSIARTDEQGDLICNIGSSGIELFTRQVQ